MIPERHDATQSQQTHHSPIRQWIKSLDEMRKLDPEFLVPSHTRPLAGREVIQQKLRDYRDGIQWVYVSTVRGANDGRSVDELAETVRGAVGLLGVWLVVCGYIHPHHQRLRVC